MQLPKSIKVGGHQYEVTFPHHFIELSNVAGQADHQLKTIRISDVDASGNRKAESAIREAFLHEIIHCADTLCVSDLTEHQVEGLSEALYQILTDNFIISLKPVP